MKAVFNFLKHYNNAFIISIVLGYIIWFAFYIIIPVQTQSLSFQTVSFIICATLSLILGYYSIKQKHKPLVHTKQKNYFLLISLLAILGLGFRYFDLFYFRQLSLNNPYYLNKSISIKAVSQSNLIVLIIATLRILSPIPVLYLIVNQSREKKNWIIATIIIAISTIEMALYGTRKPLFHLFLLILIAYYYSNRKPIQINLKTVLIASISVTCLGMFSYVILNKRLNEREQTNNKLINVVDSRYNDFVKIEDYKIEAFKKQPNSFFTNVEILFIHTGQYVIHGFYELDYIVKNNFSHAKGVYSFNPIFKLTNRLKLTNTELNTQKNHPRDYVYTSFFGSLFIDFGWFSLVPIFLFGVFQKTIFLLSQHHTITKVFFIILLSVNLTLPIFNLLSGSGLYLFIMLTIFSIYCYLKKLDRL